MASKQKRHDKPHAALLAAAMLVSGVLLIAGSLLAQDMTLNREAAEYDQWRIQLKAGDETVLEPVLVPDTSSVGNTSSQDDEALKEYSPAITFIPSISGETHADFAACQAENVDFIGWLQIPGTNVDHPVVQTDDPDYYLSHAFSGQKSSAGTLFALAKTDFATPSQNIAVYGHHLSSSGEKMFTSLMRYKDQAFYAGHETVYFDTLYACGVYRIFAVVNMLITDWGASTADFDSDDEFLDFVNRAQSQALYDTGVEVAATDHILTLITCDRSYAGKDGRLVVMAVQE